jgi:SAM-dependent methyltransferase
MRPMDSDPSEIVRKGYDQAAVNYQKERSEDLLEIGLFQEFTNSCDSILELGCGSGYPVAKYLIEQKKDYTGVDISEQQILLAKDKYQMGKFLVSDMVNYLEHSSENQYDGVLVLFSLFHVPRYLHALVLQKIYLTLKPGGYLLMNTGNYAYEGTEKDWLGAEEMYWSMMSPEWYEITLKDLGFGKIVHKLVAKEFMGEQETTHYFYVQRSY